MLEPGHEVIREAHDDHVTVCVLASPLPDPPVDDIVEVDIGKQRGGRCPLGRPPIARRPRSVLDNSYGHPLANEPQDPLVRNRVLEELLRQP
jgi:hypothetical protein